MKKSISVVVLICFICLTFSGCFFWRGESEREIEINESVNKIYYDLKKHLHDPGDLDAILMGCSTKHSRFIRQQ